ncbi:DNA-3-methyladenine glycosylase I [Alteromonas pelagimontana]|uniref:DNA-3-methyladenine glycosylase I n=2 Tax=Alteromonas pelagimontana TaxID=1858656 RepID=A0A6M4MIK8_9ALTE|nr:DNA-3-methyladenine glycosylase I [Alteromonas pelagimontana]
MKHYHDTEWGVPVRDSRLLWETLMLEGFQAGLSWEIILRKREAFREAFEGFDPKKVASFDEPKVESLMNNSKIVRSRAKIEATIQGAKIFNNMQASGEDFSTYCWSFTNGKVILGSFLNTQTELSGVISKSMKKRGFKFVGPTIVYAWMQAVGITNDHSDTCFRRQVG